VLAVLKAYGTLTSDEVADKLAVSVLTVRPRFTALRRAGRVVDASQRRKNAKGRRTIIWRVA
jgi:predicted ArsR family transcriptional regulator